MSDPVTLSLAISAGAALAGGGIQFSQAQYQGQVAGMNAKIAEENAQRAIERTQIEAMDSDQQAAQEIAEQVSQQAASGTSLTGRSHTLTRRASRVLARRDALNIIQGGQIEAYNYRVQKANFLAEKKASNLQKYLSVAETGGKLANIYGSSLVGGSKSTLFSPGSTIGGPGPKKINLL